VFPPYNALQIQTILKQRAEQAFKQGAVDEGVVEKCAAFAAREHGDARKAVELLRVAGELAERECSSKVLMKHLDSAQEKIDKDKIQELVSLQPKQHQAVLYAAILVNEKRKEQIYTGEICETYNSICSQAGLRPLTQRRVSDIIAEFDMLGILSAKVISKGRYGRTREISVSIPSGSQEKVKKILQEGLGMC
jgi:cell division control protein 6